jgi:hypothetical protein
MKWNRIEIGLSDVRNHVLTAKACRDSVCATSPYL